MPPIKPLAFAIALAAAFAVLADDRPTVPATTIAALPLPGGAAFSHEVRHDPNQSLHVVTIDLTAPGVSVGVARGGPDPDGDGKWTTTLLPVREIAAREHFDVAVNGDFFAALQTKDIEGRNTGFVRGKWASPQGPAVTDGALWQSAPATRPALLVGDGRAAVASVDPRKPMPTWVRQAVGGNALLAHDGKVLSQKNKDRHPRTVAGVDATGTRLFLLVVDGRQPNLSIGMTYEELGREMVRLGAADAVNLDGGGSTTMVLRDPRAATQPAGGAGTQSTAAARAADAFPLVVANSPSDGRERSVADVLGVRLGHAVPATQLATRPAAPIRPSLPAAVPATSPSTRTASVTTSPDGRVTVVPTEDPSAVLHNPDMGWVLYENFPLDAQPGGSSTMVNLPNERFDGVDHVAVMFSWADVERREGEYDFAAVDRAYDHWRAKGKPIQLRLSTESLLWWANRTPPAGLGVPPFVLDRFPADRKQRRLCDGLPYDLVDARNPYYLDRLTKFLTAVAKHFDKSRPVGLVDLRGFGLWGEWHTGYQYATVDDRRAALGGVIDRYAAAFPKHYLALSASYDPDSPKELRDGPTKQYDAAFTKTYDAFVRYSAFDLALAKPNVTFRRDGAGGAVHSNERRMIDEAFRTAARGPMMSEFVDGYASSKKGAPGWVEWRVDDALSLHPNYVNLLGWQGPDALAFLRERPDLIAHGLRRMGYRLVPVKVTYPATVVAGQPIDIAMEWVNRGVGRAMRDLELSLSFDDGVGLSAATVSGGTVRASRWIAGETFPALGTAVVPAPLPAGSYELRLSLTDPVAGVRIGLPLADGRPGQSYAIGRVTIVRPAADPGGERN